MNSKTLTASWSTAMVLWFALLGGLLGGCQSSPEPEYGTKSATVKIEFAHRIPEKTPKVVEAWIISLDSWVGGRFETRINELNQLVREDSSRADALRKQLVKDLDTRKSKSLKRPVSELDLYLRDQFVVILYSGKLIYEMFNPEHLDPRVVVVQL